nr:hypothetical protein [Tanacetum cinerariifolium]
MISLELSLSKSFLVVGINCRVLVNSSSSKSIILILACHAPSPSLGVPSSLRIYPALCYGLEHELGLQEPIVIEGTVQDRTVRLEPVSPRLFCSGLKVYYLPIALLHRSKMSFHQALDLIFNLDEVAVRCTRDILRQRDCLDRLSEIPWVILTFVVIEGEDIVAKFCSPSRWKELSKETSSKILPCGDGTCWKTMTNLADKAILSGADNRPPMLEKGMYDLWKSIMELYMLNRQHGRMILESVKNGPLLWPTVEENKVTRPKKYSELSTTEAVQADCDVKATNIILQGISPEVYALVSTHKVAKDLWERIQMPCKERH